MRTTVLIALITSLVSLVRSARAQGTKDSATVAEAKAAYRLISQDPDSAYSIAEKDLLSARRTGDRLLAAHAYLARGWASFHKGAYNKTFPDLITAAQLFHQVHDTKNEMRTYVNLGMAYSQHSEFANSANYLIRGDSLAQVLNDDTTKAEVKRQMAILYREQGRYPEAIANFRESMRIFRALRDTIRFFGAASSLGATYMAMSKPDSSLAILRDCLPMTGALHAYEKGMLLEHYGDAWFALNQYDKAMDSYNGAYRLFLNNHNRADMAYEAMNLGKTFTRLKKYADAESWLLLSYRVNDSLKMANYTHDVAEQLSDLFKATGDWHKAYRWLAVKDSLRDSLDLRAVNEKTAQLQAQYEADKKEKEISLLKDERELNLAIVERQRVFQRGLVVVVVLLILIGLLIIGRYRSAARAKQLIELEKMRNQIARDLHDDMGSALSSIHIISRVALSNGGDTAKMIDRMRKIHEYSGLILENMSDIVWTINPANDTLEKVLFKMREFAADIFDPLNIEYVFRQEGDFAGTRLGLQTRRDLYLIFKEAVNNAAKYSLCSKVMITVGVTDGRVDVRIADDGAGFDKEEVKFGNGLKNMEERARRIGAQLDIASAPGSGTTVSLRLRSHH
ncbi:MAG TPA: ATP-binding protein [Puia sp.]|nr:ATP-binding protein [Puia sp.]